MPRHRSYARGRGDSHGGTCSRGSWRSRQEVPAWSHVSQMHNKHSVHDALYMHKYMYTCTPVHVHVYMYTCTCVHVPVHVHGYTNKHHYLKSLMTNMYKVHAHVYERHTKDITI